jgi:phage shock protein E
MKLNLIAVCTIALSSIMSFNTFAAEEHSEGIWIDVRSSVEYSMGHVEGSHNIAYDEVAEEIASITTDKNANIHLYCRSGGRAGKALKSLQDLGYTNVHNDGGLADLQHPAKLAE